jgi:hypothetical protein
MTEEEWVAVVAADTDTGAMQAYLSGKGSARQMRLFACACCRRIEPLMIDPRSRQAVVVLERWADGAATIEELKAVWHEAHKAAVEIDDNLGEEEGDSPQYHAALAAHFCAISFDSDGAAEVSHSAFYALRAADSPIEPLAQARLLGDVLGRPQTIVRPKPGWLTSEVVAVARTIYEERRFADVPILADALEDAGCSDAGVLAHCRADAPHVRGCWVLDLVLGKR